MSDATKPPMSTMPRWLDRPKWILANSREYFIFARHLTEQSVHYETTGTRKPMHRAGTTYWKDGRRDAQ